MEPTERVNLKVIGEEGDEIFFSIKRSTRLEKLRKAYCDLQEVDFNSIAFLFDGRRLRAGQTADELEMEDGDEIYALPYLGGHNNFRVNDPLEMEEGDEIDAELHRAMGINVIVRNLVGNEVFFRIKRSTQLKAVMNSYCDQQAVDFNSTAFLFLGRQLQAGQTPDELEMEDGDEIYALPHLGGHNNFGVNDHAVGLDQN